MAIAKATKWSGTWMGAMLLLTPFPVTGQMPPPSIDALGRSVFSALPAVDRPLAAGDTIQGDLTTSNPIQGGGRRLEVWELAADAGGRLRIDMQSGDFDPFLFVVGPGLGAGLRNDDGGDGLNASLCFTPGGAEGYRVVAAALHGGTGRYTLSVTPSSSLAGDCGFHDGFLVAVDSLGSLADSSGRVLRIDDVVEDVLDAGMGIMDGFHGSAWRLDVPPGRVRIEMRSSEVDAFLYVSGPGMPDGLGDDDGGVGTNARLCFSSSAAAEYRVVAAARGQDQNGRFTLSVRREQSEGSCGGLRSQSPPEGNRVAEGERVTGALHPGEADGGIHAWELAAEPGRRIRIDVRSDDLDPVVHVFGPNPADSLYDDDGGEGLNARLCFTPSQLESHRIVVTAWDAEGGTYALSVNADDGPECGATADPSSIRRELVEASAGAEVSGDPPASDIPADVSVFSLLDAGDRHVGVGESIAGSLTERDFLQGGGRRVQVWNLNASAGQRFRVDLASRSFAPFLYFVGPGLGGGLRGESGPPALKDTEGHAWLCFATARNAGYRVVASSAGGETGDFTLSVVDLAQGADDDCRPPVVYVATFNAEPDVQYHISYYGEVARTTTGGSEFWGNLLPGSGPYDWLLHEAETGLRFGVGYPVRSGPGALRYRIEGAQGRVLGHVVGIG